MDEEKGGTIEMPHEYICPITQEIMHDPVVAADGHSYERSAITQWLNDGHRLSLSPMTGKRLQHKELTPNHALRKLTQDFLITRNKALDDSHSQNPLLMAACEGNLATVKTILLANKHLASVRDEQGNTAFLLACHRGHLAIVKWLLENQFARLSDTNDTGETGLVLADEAHAGEVTNFLKLDWLKPAGDQPVSQVPSVPSWNEKTADNDSKLDADTQAKRKECERLELLAQQGDAHAQNNLGVMYQFGWYVGADGQTQQSDRQAALYFERAAAQGSAGAQTHLGWMYQFGRYVGADGETVQSNQQACHYYERAAAQGYANAQFNLKELLAKNTGLLAASSRFYPAVSSNSDDNSAEKSDGVLHTSPQPSALS